MNYLYFDIECCDGNHICSFGYVIVNEEFKILDKKDILINPEHAFKLGRAGFDPRIHLAYTEAEFINGSNFGEEYEEIKQILTRPNQIVLGQHIKRVIGGTVDISQCSYIVINNIMNIIEKEWFESVPKNERPQIISINEISELLKISINKFGELKENCSKKETSLRKIIGDARKSSHKQQKRKMDNKKPRLHSAFLYIATDL